MIKSHMLYQLSYMSVWRTVQASPGTCTALPVFPGRHRKEILMKMGGYGHPWSR